MYFFVWRDLKVRYKQTVVGALWAVIQPFAVMIVFTVFFGRLAEIPSDGIPYPIFYFSALVPWTYFTSAVSQATNSVVGNRQLVTKVYFPRISLPISSVISPLVDLAIAMVVVAAMMAYYRITPTINALFLPLFLLLAIATATAVGLWFAALNAEYRDIRYAAPLVLQFWMFASPVAYPTSLVPESWRWLYGLNPMAGVIEGFRWALTGKGIPPGRITIASVVAVIVVLVGGLIYFRRTETQMADVV